MQPHYTILDVASERYAKLHIVLIGAGQFGVVGMSPVLAYLLKAAELSAEAQVETDPARKVELENLTRAYLRLAEQAERNSHTDIVYETRPKRDRDQP